MDKGLEFMLEGALNKDVEASSITCRLMADDGSSEEKYYLRHDEAKVRTLAPPLLLIIKSIKLAILLAYHLRGDHPNRFLCNGRDNLPDYLTKSSWCTNSASPCVCAALLAAGTPTRYTRG